jgi:hypothetical protein
LREAATRRLGFDPEQKDLVFQRQRGPLTIDKY